MDRRRHHPCTLAPRASVDGADDPSRRGFLQAASTGSVLAAVGLPAMGRRGAAVAAATSPKPPGPDAPFVLSQLQESITGLVSGSVVSTTKVLVKHPLDTVSVRLQFQEGKQLTRRQLWDGVFKGVVPPLLFAAPSGSIFFGVKDGVKAACKAGSLFDVKMSRNLATVVGVFVAQFPYWAIRNPSEVIKTRAQVTSDEDGTTPLATLRAIVRDEGWQALWLGYGENIAYAFPADALKFGIYEFVAGGRPKNAIPPLEGAVLGALSTGVAQALTTPLDVVRNRVMVKGDSELSYLGTLAEIAQKEGATGLFAGCTPRVGKAALSGAVQFGTYEITRGSMWRYFSSRQQQGK